MMPRMRIEDLKAVVALGSHARLTDAAATLQMSQPSLSRLLSRVESELGARLFERRPHGVVVTPAGELALRGMAEVIDRWDQLVGVLSGLADPDSGTVRLAFLDSIATSLVPQILAGVRELAPRMSILLRQEPGHEIRRDLEDGTVELALIWPRPDGAYAWLPVQDQRLVVVVPPRHRLAARRRVTLQEIADEDLLTVPVGFGFRTLVDELFAAAGLAPNVSLEITDLATIEGLVGAGLGVAVLPEAVAGASGTKSLALAGPEAHRVVGLTWRSDRELSAPAARFVGYVDDVRGRLERP